MELNGKELAVEEIKFLSRDSKIYFPLDNLK